MSARIAARDAKRRRKIIAAVWITSLGALTSSLIYWELTALLYVLATLGVTAMLIVVALSDISHADHSPSPGSLPAPPAGATTQGVGKTDWGAKKSS